MSVRLHLRRDRGIADFARRYCIDLDGTEIGRIGRGGTFACDIAPGFHELQLRIDWCTSNVVPFDAADGMALHFACGSNLRGWRIWRAAKLLREAPHAWMWLATADAPRT